MVRVAAINAGGSSAYSNTDSAKTDPAGAGTSLVVDSIVVSTQSAGKGWKNGRAEVVIKDDAGNLVAGALVNGDFRGAITEEVTQAQTGADGSVTVVTSGQDKKIRDLTFCVTSVTHADLADYSGQPICSSL